jgi:hypothetical protein
MIIVRAGFIPVSMDDIRNAFPIRSTKTPFVRKTPRSRQKVRRGDSRGNETANAQKRSRYDGPEPQET